jgi:hypothetical protein
MSDEVLKKSPSSDFRMKVSEKGAISVYGMGRFPVTLYKEQWLKLLESGGNSARLKFLGHQTEPPRVRRRPFRLSHAASAFSSSMA